MAGPYTAPPIGWACAYPPSGGQAGTVFVVVPIEIQPGEWDAWSLNAPYDGSGSFASPSLSGTVTATGIQRDGRGRWTARMSTCLTSELLRSR